MYRRAIIVTVVLMASTAVGTGGAAAIETGVPVAAIDTILAEWNRADQPGVAVLVQQHGRDLYRRCSGAASVEHSVPITPQTSFDLASVSKHLTAFAVLLLEQRGQIGLDDNIHQYLPELPGYCQQITVGDLLYQSSGLWEFWSILNRYSGFNNRDYFSMTDVLSLVAGQEEPLFEPGTRYSYTNTNYALLSVIVSRITGETFGAWTKANVFEPLGMKATHFQEDCTTLIPNLASAYRRRGDELIAARPMNVDIPGSAHAFTTLDDMSRWLDNFRTRKLGGDGIFGRMFNRGVLRNGDTTYYTAGLIADRFHGSRMLQHSGQTGGYKTMIVYCPEEELGIVVLANERSIPAYGLSQRILDLFIGSEEPEEEAGSRTSSRDRVDLDPEDLSRFAGGYRLEDDGRLAGVYRDGHLLVVSVKGLGKEYVYPVSATEFIGYGGSTSIAFEVNPDGSVTGARVTIGDQELTASQIASADDSTLAADIAGTYCSEALAAICNVSVEGEQTILSHRRYADIPLQWVAPGRYVGSWGFVEFTYNQAGDIDGFELWDELLGPSSVRFARVPE